MDRDYLSFRLIDSQSFRDKIVSIDKNYRIEFEISNKLKIKTEL